MLKAENLVLYVDENGSRKCLLDSYLIPGG